MTDNAAVYSVHAPGSRNAHHMGLATWICRSRGLRVPQNFFGLCHAATVVRLYYYSLILFSAVFPSICRRAVTEFTSNCDCDRREASTAGTNVSAEIDKLWC